MSRSSYGHYTGTFPVIDAMYRGETTPGVELCESVVPGVGYGMMPAPWLPITRFDKWVNSGVVISVGTPVGFDANGFLVPAGIQGGTTTVTYSQYDVDMGVINVNTGSAVAAASTTVTVPSSLCPVLGVIPVGVATYNIYQHLGGVTWNNTTKVYSVDNHDPYSWRMNNTTKEDFVAFTCDYVLEVPWVGTTVPTGLSSTALSYAHAYGTFTYGCVVSVDTTYPGVFTAGSTRADRLFIGQCIGIKQYVTSGVPLGALNRVKTAYENSSNVAWKMPGSATAGVPRAIHLATDGAFAADPTSTDAANFTSIIINMQL